MDNRSASKNSDCVSDLRLERRLKRRSVANRCFRRNSYGHALRKMKNNPGKETPGLMDSEKIPSSMYEHSGYDDCGFDRTGNRVNDVSDGYEDPQYKWFLENLKQDGNSYGLVILPENDKPEVINYEIVDWLPDEYMPETPKAIECGPVTRKTNKGKKILREVSDVERLETLNGLGEFSGGDVWSQRTLRYQARNEKKQILITSDDVLVKRRKTRSVARKASVGTSGRSRRISSPESSCFVELEDDICEDYFRYVNPGFGRTGGGSFTRSVLKGNDFVEHEFYHEAVSDGAHEEYRRLPNLFSDGTSGQLNTKTSSDGKFECKQEDESGDIAQDYMEFLELLEMECEDRMYKTDDGPQRFDEVEESDSDSDILVTDKDPYGGGNSTPFVSTQPLLIDLDNYSVAEDCGTTSRAQFKKELIEILKRPYDPKQHESFMQEVQCRKPLLEERNLRGKIKTFPSKNKLAKSYLELYSDFAELIDLAKNDKSKSLNLLRGFFYWLKNMAHDGMFRPWKDPSVLEVLPQE